MNAFDFRGYTFAYDGRADDLDGFHIVYALVFPRMGGDECDSCYIGRTDDSLIRCIRNHCNNASRNPSPLYERMRRCRNTKTVIRIRILKVCETATDTAYTESAYIRKTKEKFLQIALREGIVDEEHQKIFVSRRCLNDGVKFKG